MTRSWCNIEPSRVHKYVCGRSRKVWALPLFGWFLLAKGPKIQYLPTCWIFWQRFNISTLEYAIDALSERASLGTSVPWVWKAPYLFRPTPLQISDQRVVYACMYTGLLSSAMTKVGQNHIFIRIHDVDTVFGQGNPYIRSYMVCIYDSGQP
jgi:hypothetical protein